MDEIITTTTTIYDGVIGDDVINSYCVKDDYRSIFNATVYNSTTTEVYKKAIQIHSLELRALVNIYYSRTGDSNIKIERTIKEVHQIYNGPSDQCPEINQADYEGKLEVKELELYDKTKSKSITLIGKESPEKTMIDGTDLNNYEPLIIIDDMKGNVTLKGLKIQNGIKNWVGGGIFCRRGIYGTINPALYITNCVFENLTVTKDCGGAIYCCDCVLEIENTIFRNNSARDFGGAIQCEDCDVKLSRTTFENNKAGIGGAIWAEHSDIKIDPMCRFKNNTATESKNNIFLKDSSIEENPKSNGDLNSDGVITPADALIVFNGYLEKGPCYYGADVNKDDSVTPKDAICIFNKFLGKASCLDQ
ncbi:MAG: dockerin type I domain-containing protein [bacterium]